MKILKFITAITTLLTLSFSANAQTEGPDTISAKTTIEEITITSGKRVSVMEISENSDTTCYTYIVTGENTGPVFLSPQGWDVGRLFRPRKSRRGRNPWSKITTEGFKGVYAGGLIATGDHFPVTGGWEFGVKNVIALSIGADSGLPSLSIGAGLGWKFQTVGHGFVLGSSNGHLYLTPTPENSYNSSSRMRHFHFTIPISLHIPFHKTFGLDLGGELHLNSYSTATSTWDALSPTEGMIGKQKWIFKGLHQRVATFEVYGAIGWSDYVSAYFSWAPVNPWRNGCGPQYHTFGIGAILEL